MIEERESPRKLIWAIHERFIAYVERQIPDAEISCSRGAYRDTDGAFCFPQATSVSGTELCFLGVVHFTGHGGMLDMRIKDPRIASRGSGQALSIVDAIDDASRIDFAELLTVPGADGDGGVIEFDVRINAFSSQEMGGVYPAGSEMARIVVSEK
ncbi:HtaA domain-containing protein [Leucobacter sp. Z1108]|uniref:HtaA domain-containing protein n=1 Tax=Leucobacter sp. Z1108 TaxID=3439066 RepID=UPI003F2B6288